MTLLFCIDQICMLEFQMAKKSNQLLLLNIVICFCDTRMSINYFGYNERQEQTYAGPIFHTVRAAGYQSAVVVVSAHVLQPRPENLINKLSS